MIVLWIIFFCLQQAYSLVPVKTVRLGEPATLTCALPKELSSRGVNWYKQSVGDTLKLIATLYKSTSDYGPGFSSTRIQVHKDKNFTSLTILKTVQEDEALYHCANTEWIGTTWSGTYLLIKGDTQGVSNYTVSQLLIEMNPVRPGDTMTLQCSVFSHSENKTCPGDLNVLWFRAGSNKSHPNIIYADRNRRNEYETRSETQQSCVFRFSKNVSSSDAGTYYCAVATCGEILFGNGTTLDIQESSVWSQRASTLIFLLCAVLFITLIVIAALIYTIKTNSDHCKAAVLHKNFSDQKSQQNKCTWIFSAVVFTVMKVDRSKLKDAKAAKQQQIHMAVKNFGLD
ncbi:signal-regulatory protein beta-2-like [Archocentrus centrarchus]|uniref:signal-regulatory protein beta-2-like n=1 Tax=Archocentrus centrarchus TaxID=63155 RepID=UPI0011E9EAD9|nr:signal-regulatory protein beta-2-like [Archocentrus centrarchus]